jgi:hypothetical protein
VGEAASVPLPYLQEAARDQPSKEAEVVTHSKREDGLCSVCYQIFPCSSGDLEKELRARIDELEAELVALVPDKYKR